MARKLSSIPPPAYPICNGGEVYLIEKGISYQDIDVAASREVAHEMVQKSGQMGVPVILVDDELVVGFNQPKLDELMAK